MRHIRVPLLFAFRYLFSKKSVNAINIISLISVVGVFVSTAALVIVLSFYNGMESFILSMYSTFTPELRIEPTKGKVFSTDTPEFKKIAADQRIKSYCEVLEDKILLQYDNQQFIGQLKGMDPEGLSKQGTENILHTGKYTLQKDTTYYALIGAQVQANLKVPISGIYNTIELFSPRKGTSAHNVNPLDDFNSRKISLSGVLTYQPEFDNLVIVPLAFARDLLGETDKITAVEIFLSDSLYSNVVQHEIQQTLGTDFSVKNREEQNPTLYKTIKSEKWIVFFILTFIGIIAIFNIVGSLTMLVIDKKDDMKVLQSLGAEQSMIARIFFIEGILISLIGGVVGIIVGYLFCKLQEAYGFVRTGETDGSLIDVYPVDIRSEDFVLVFVTVATLSLIVSYFSSKLSVREIGNT
ncbi:FtsX-like permease family protein [Sphingobacterium lumbrici]|uniref:FtsX-like permease family protein n=1 Tax=Sphingobacterium lumbrici TaxID=2559600 RepID=UPI00112C4132|nr:FtsX-like permease family protein [Sphingobacterium lumbrici]